MGVGDGLMARYGSAEGAAAYRRKYERSLLRRLSARREERLLRRALAAAGARGHALDVPCGAGRMAGVLLERAERVTGVDLSPAMLAEAGAALAPLVAAGRVALAPGSAEALPFPDASFDVAVCWRLLHHLVLPADRVRVLSELRRVSRGPVIVTFADATTWKARMQRRRGRQRRCASLAPADLASEAARAGLRLAGSRRLSSAFSLLAAAVLRPAGS